MPATAAATTRHRLTTLLGSTLETVLHELLYIRRIYPRDTFAPTRYLGIRCHANRHPGVVEYVGGTLTVGVPAICAGLADELSLVILEAGSQRVIERFTFHFDVESMVTASAVVDGEKTENQPSGNIQLAVIVRQLERGMRDMILRVISMEGEMEGKKKRMPDGATFKICLHMLPSKRGGNGVDGDGDGREGKFLASRQCPELDEALREGRWYRPDAAACLFESSYRGGGATGEGGGKAPEAGEEQPAEHRRGERSSRGLTRPLKSVSVPSCGLRMQLLMELSDM